MLKLREITRSILQGDNLPILQMIPTESVDLIYIDPPFFTQSDQRNDWIPGNQHGYRDTASFFEHGSQAKGILAYIDWMRVRIEELKRILAKTGSIYVHCDYHASHYLRVMLDQVFGPKRFINEIVWKRKFSCTHTNRIPTSFQNNHDTIFLYSKSEGYFFQPQFRPYDKRYIDQFNLTEESGERYMSVNLTSPTYRKNLVYTYKGYEPTAKGWSVSKDVMKKLDREGLLIFPKEKSGRIRRKSYLKDKKGFPISNIWDDIGCVQGQSTEKTNWPTQKPLALLERIIATSSRPGDTVLDCFSGSGTTAVAAESLKRNWIGIEMSAAANRIACQRLREISDDIKVVKMERQSIILHSSRLRKAS